MKITKNYLKQVIKEEYSAMQNSLSPVKKELLAVLSQRARGGMDVELLVHVLTDQEAEVLLKQQKPQLSEGLVYCSQCGEEFDIPGKKTGFSHCETHKDKKSTGR